jgi:uncharacterized protein
MTLTFNLCHLEKKNLELQGEISAAELEIEALDDLIHVSKPLVYDFEIQRLEGNILVTGSLVLELDCECVRCLKAFPYRLELADWTCLLPLSGEDAVAIKNDVVDLTPYVREDILLGFPQHPLCEPECGGMQLPPQTEQEKAKPSGLAQGSPVWTVLDKLKLNE